MNLKRTTCTSRPLSCAAKALLPILVLVLCEHTLQVGSATWKLDPLTTDWHSASNWVPNTIPNGPNDIATFDVTNDPYRTPSTRNIDTEVSSSFSILVPPPSIILV